MTGSNGKIIFMCLNLYNQQVSKSKMWIPSPLGGCFFPPDIIQGSYLKKRASYLRTMPSSLVNVLDD